MLRDLEDVVILTRKKNPHHWQGAFDTARHPKYGTTYWYGMVLPHQPQKNGLTYDITSSFFTLEIVCISVNISREDF